MFLFNFLFTIVSGVCRLLIIVGLGCFIINTGLEKLDYSLGEIDKQEANAFLQASYNAAAEQLEASWEELRKYRIVIIKKDV